MRALLLVLLLVPFVISLLGCIARIRLAVRRCREARERTFRDGMICIRCGYNMRSHPERCSECGYRPGEGRGRR